MNLMKRTCATLVLTVTLAVPAAAQQNSLEVARDLYASARYDEALLVLNGLRPNPNVTTDLKWIEQYRSLCLLALGRPHRGAAAAVHQIAHWNRPSMKALVSGADGKRRRSWLP